MRYRMRCYYSAHLIPFFLQDTLCLVAPYPFRLEPLEDFDPLVDFDMTGGNDVWFARPQLFFTCSLCPTGRSQDKSSHREVSLVFFSTLPISLTPNSFMQRSGIPMVYERTAFNTLCLPCGKRSRQSPTHSMLPSGEQSQHSSVQPPTPCSRGCCC